MAYWIIKSDPDEYSWEDFNSDSVTSWTGIRNFQARNYLGQMKLGDTILFYLSGKSKKIVGLAEILKEAYPDPTANEGEWLAVEIAALKSLRKAVSLEQMKEHAKLQDMLLLRQQRISVTPLSDEEYQVIIDMSK